MIIKNRHFLSVVFVGLLPSAVTSAYAGGQFDGLMNGLVSSTCQVAVKAAEDEYPNENSFYIPETYASYDGNLKKAHEEYVAELNQQYQENEAAIPAINQFIRTGLSKKSRDLLAAQQSSHVTVDNSDPNSPTSYESLLKNSLNADLQAALKAGNLPAGAIGIAGINGKPYCDGPLSVQLNQSVCVSPSLSGVSNVKMSPTIIGATLGYHLAFDYVWNSSGNGQHLALVARFYKRSEKQAKSNPHWTDWDKVDGDDDGVEEVYSTREIDFGLDQIKKGTLVTQKSPGMMSIQSPPAESLQQYVDETVGTVCTGQDKKVLDEQASASDPMKQLNLQSGNSGDATGKTVSPSK